MRAPELLNEFLRAVCGVSQASSASMLVHMEPAEPQTLLLASVGEAAAIPELRDEAAAWLLLSQRPTDGRNPSLSTHASSDPDCVLLHLPLTHILARPESLRRSIGERRNQPTVVAAPPLDGSLWIGLRNARAADALVQSLAAPATGQHPADRGDASGWLGHLLNLSTRLSWSIYQLTLSLQDPVSQLAGRMEFQQFLKRLLAAAGQEHQPVGLLLINPDDFAMINHRYGREYGDMAVREIADRLVASLRQTDGVFRYAGAVFGAVLPATNVEQTQAAAEKVHRSLSQLDYIDGAARLTFSVGGAVALPEDFARETIEAADLLKRADSALMLAKLSGGARVIVGRIDQTEQLVGHLDPLSGIFTADTEKDYRNMLLLWETVGLVSSNAEPEQIVKDFVARIALAFRPDIVALFRPTESGFTALATNVRDASSVDGRASNHAIEVTAARGELIKRAFASGHAERSRSADDERLKRVAYALPLIARERPIGCLYLDGVARRWQLDSSDILFLNALVSQVAVALDRAELAAHWIRQMDTESRQLRVEVRDLRQAIAHTKMVYQSREMHAVVETLRRVAPSDATVLITGESGTGKEMLARTLHDLSARRDRAFVVVDCGAIAHSLMDAELFGHVKGAYTGAESATEGRIFQAHGGTLFLDEIGELPLEVQAKLLRFVQEKEIVAVGSAESRRVDARIIAATNRDLPREVSAGRFRADLYYRLQVIVVNAIPLRQRSDDIAPLAHYFLEKFALQYGQGSKRLSVPTLQVLQRYHWPGNVRELQHCMMRAVLMSDTEQIAPEHLQLGDAADHHPPNATRESTTAKPAAVFPASTESQTSDPWIGLRDELVVQIGHAMQLNRNRPAPLGRWLDEDFVLAVNEQVGVARQGAAVVGIPESTFRRQLEKALADHEAGLLKRTAQWQSTRSLIDRLVAAAARTPGEDVLERARRILLGEVHARFVDKPSIGAALMGVSLPTYKRWVQALPEIGEC